MTVQFEAEAQRLMAMRSANASNRFLDAVVRVDSLDEPAGRLAGFPIKPQLIDSDLPTLLSQVIDVVLQVGRLLSSEWDRVDGPRGQGDKAVVDVEIEYLLRQQLIDLHSCDFWGEETGRTLTGNPWCWVVDPNDGTSDFLNGLKGSAISVGLLYKQTPVLGVVYAPVTKEDIPDCIAWAEGLPNLLRNGEPVMTKLTGTQLSSSTCVMVSSAAVNQPSINRELCSPGRFVAMPSIAYRIAKVAAGDGVCAVSLCTVYAHDVVAGHALLRGAGGVLLDEHGEPIRYVTESKMMAVSQRCFGGSETACWELVVRDWGRIFAVDNSQA